MKTIGIIAEFNPFHNGHEYIMRAARDIYGADHVIVVMSGDHVQRGEPAVMDKYARAKAALYAGADLVLELPADKKDQEIVLNFFIENGLTVSEVERE